VPTSQTKLEKLAAIDRRIAAMKAARTREKEKVNEAERQKAERLARLIGRVFLADRDNHADTAEIIQMVLRRSRIIKPREAQFLEENGFCDPTAPATPPKS
jgi:hypothetical protein